MSGRAAEGLPVRFIESPGQGFRNRVFRIICMRATQREFLTKEQHDHHDKNSVALRETLGNSDINEFVSAKFRRDCRIHTWIT